MVGIGFLVRKMQMVVMSMKSSMFGNKMVLEMYKSSIMLKASQFFASTKAEAFSTKNLLKNP